MGFTLSLRIAQIDYIPGMNLTPSVFKTRLKCARVMRGYSMSELCERIGNAVSKMTISKYESGAMVPGEETLKLLAEALGQPLEYFSRPFSVCINDLKFRKKCRLRIKETDAIKAKVVDHLERHLYIEEVCGDRPDRPHVKRETVSSANDVVRIAADVRKEWNIGGAGIPNVIALLESRGFRVVEVDAPAAFDGMNAVANDAIDVIVLNRNFPAERKRLTALHETAHALLRFDEGIDSKTEESWCNLFASEMLISEEQLRGALGASRKQVSWREIVDLQQRYGISYDALMYKAHECGIINDQSYKWFNIHKNKEPSYKAFVEQSRYRGFESSGRFEKLVYKAVYCDLIGYEQATDLLGYSPKEFPGSELSGNSNQGGWM